MLMLLSTQMNTRSTTPASTSFAAKAVLVATSILMIVATPLMMTQRVSADRYDDQIAALQREIDGYDSQAAKLGAKRHTLENQLQRLNNEKAKIQTQIDIYEAKAKQLADKIKENQQKIQENKDALGNLISDMYLSDNVSPIEMLASSNNIGDYVDKQAYQDSIQSSLSTTIDRITELKKELEKQKVEVERVLGSQKLARDALAKKEAEKNQLIAETKGQENAFLKLSAKQKAEQENLRAQQQAAIAAAIASSGGATMVAGGADGAYPWNQSNCPMLGYFSTRGADGNGGDGHGYGCRQCASYAAWRVARETGFYPNNWGNAKDFIYSAQQVGFRTGYTPKAGSLGVMSGPSAGNYEGHVVWVESVNGGQVLVSQYNYNYGAGYGMYSKMWLSASIFDKGFVYIK